MGRDILIVIIGIGILLRRLAIRGDDARVTGLWLLCAIFNQAHPEQPLIAIIEQENQPVSNVGERLHNLRFLHAENAGVGQPISANSSYLGLASYIFRGVRPL